MRLEHIRVRFSRQDLFLCLRRRGRADGKVTLPARTAEDGPLRVCRHYFQIQVMEKEVGGLTVAPHPAAADKNSAQTLRGIHVTAEERLPALESCSFSRFRFFLFPWGKKENSHLLLTSSFFISLVCALVSCPIQTAFDRQTDGKHPHTCSSPSEE